ncbi:MAG: DUF3394 domain-containing protein, partial [Proteobacteria bacterium]|nr:DUF3394 domain-containing protein [Pseudomonadota bacterium]
DIIWLDDYLHIAWIFFSGMIAMFAFASAIQGWLIKSCNWGERLLLLAICATTFRPGAFAPYLPFDRLGMQILGVSVFFLLVAWQMTLKKTKKKRKVTT